MTEHHPRPDQEHRREQGPQADQYAEHEHVRPRPGIWVAPDADALFGWWYEATGTPEQVAARIGSGFIFDTVDFGGFHLDPTDAPDIVATVAGGIYEHGYAFAAWAEFHDADLEMLAGFNQHYLGTYANQDELIAAISERADQLQDVETLVLDGPDGEVYLFAGPG